MFNFRLFNKLSALFNLGLNNQDSEDSKRRIVLSNQVALVFLSVALPYYFIFNWMKQPFLGYSVLFFSLFFCCAFYLNYNRFFRFSKLLLILTSNIALLFYSLTLGKQSGTHLIFFALASIPFVFYNPEEIIQKSFGLLFPIVSLFFLEFFNYYPLFGFFELSDFHIRIVYLTMICITFIILIMSIRFYYIMNYRVELSLKEKAIENLMNANSKINKAYQELKQNKEIQSTMANQVAYAEVVRGISHEIKNPLHMIRISAEMISKDLVNLEQSKKCCDVVIRSVDRLVKLMDPMMKYGRVHNKFTYSEVNVLQLFDEIQRLSEGSCRLKKLTLTINCNESLTMFADRESMAQVLINLILNAQQYTSEGGFIRLEATNCTFKNENDEVVHGVCMDVVDSGIGMSKETLSKIFDPFFTSKVETHNMGLGLSIVCRYVTENKGKIEVESEEGVGTTFKILIPSKQPLQIKNSDVAVEETNSEGKEPMFLDDLF